MTDYEIYNLQSYKDGIQEDLRPIKRASFEDLDKDKINNYLEKIRKDKPNFSKFSDQKILKLSGVIENSTNEIYPTLAGLMMFGEYPQGYLPQLFVAVLLFQEQNLVMLERWDRDLMIIKEWKEPLMKCLTKH